MKIAFFDSGIGGLSVLHHAMKVLPHEQFIFFADEDNVPYGTKTTEQVFQYVSDAFSFLMTKDVKAIVVACNTATSVAVRELRHQYKIPIIGMEPAAKKALDMDTERNRVLVIATPITVRGHKIKELIEKYDTESLVDLLAMPDLVEFAEHMDFSSPAVEDYICQQFAPYDFSKYANLVLGCTHFNYFKETLRRILPDHVRLPQRSGISASDRRILLFGKGRHRASRIAAYRRLSGPAGTGLYHHLIFYNMADPDLPQVKQELSSPD